MTLGTETKFAGNARRSLINRSASSPFLRKKGRSLDFQYDAPVHHHYPYSIPPVTATRAPHHPTRKPSIEH
ncbi:hypothetical protein ColTof4_01730 [Colletotrichum tofieldiae]|nr:hypothetical protein ColTof3_09987 [Colletotrichum tofieldiae]GKT69307.1 hypothetical protein ColTof4_01730 [Colletotrichum tofieldiae]